MGKERMSSQEKREIFKLIFSGIQAIGIVFIVVSAFLAYRSYIDSNKWKRYEIAYDLLKRFEKFEDLRSKLKECFPELNGNFPENYKPLSIDKFKEIYNNDIVKIRNKECDARCIRENLVKVHNYFEDVAYAYNKGLADSELIEKSLKHLILRIDRIFSNFREAVKYRDKDNPRDNWPPIKELVDKWKKEK